jgi:hypothetical protein
MKPVHCKHCGATLRAIVGIQREGEPRIYTDHLGPYIQCPRCGLQNRELTPARIAERRAEVANGEGLG